MHPCYAMHRTMKGRANKSRSVAALFMRLTKYRSGTSFGSSSASRQLCCWPLKLSKRGKLRHKQVERAMKAFWRQPMLRACVCVYILYIIYIYTHTEAAPLGTQTSNVDTCNWTLRALTILRESRREGGGRKQPSATREIQGEIARVNLYPSPRNKRFSSPFFPKNNLSIKGENRILPPSSKRYFAIYWFNRSPERFARFIVIHFSGYNRRIIRGGQKYSGTLQAE